MSTDPMRPVPDDRIHGDDYRQAEPGDAAGEQVNRASTRPYWVLAGLGAALVVGSLVGAGAWTSLTGGAWHSADERQVYAQPVSAVTIDGGADDVEVRGGGTSGRVEVVRHLSWGQGSSRPAVSETWSGQTLQIGSACNGVVDFCSVDYVVIVPDTTAVAITGGSGDVELVGALGEVDVKTGSGRLDGRDLASATLKATAGSGDIDLSFETAPTSLTLEAGSGDVSVRVPDDRGYATAITTGSGEEDVSARVDPGSQSRLTIRTGSGDVEVTSS
ncbi:putative adhesin [Humibacillus xanthopallidus]|uniref:Putative adhesin n=1 Tax=Humibacillus xanthopallidus TaxID=412689 RepID=A0A543PNT8_9MICO|nr:DUF4097 family beta strand repeat-containing protein [Humibacillus xanthopallidus]TQN45748.1 putative adhesin [Humibacillus xanthopallidus]